MHGVTFHVDDAEIVGLLGRNGVGRSTTIKAIMGDVPPRGSIRYRGEEIAGLRPHQTARIGLGYVPETRDIFPGLTVRQRGRAPFRRRAADADDLPDVDG